jgi:hypothetical protein
MADYNPPIENLPIFDPSVFNTGDQYITQNDADKRYLRYPNAQGTENFGQINVNGTATFTTSAVMKKPLLLNSTTSSDREIQNTTYTMIDKTGNTSVGKLYADIADFYYECNGNGKSHIFLNNSISGAQSTTLQMNTSNFIINSTNLPTAPLATLPASTDSSTKIPTTAWVQSAITSGGSTTQTVSFTASGTTTTPTNCRFVDIQVIGYGGECGVSAFGPPVYYGGSGSGGNMALISGASMEGGLTLTFTFVATSTTGYVQVQYTDASGSLVNIAKVYNGSKGADASIGSGGIGGPVNTTASQTNSNFGAWTTAFGTAGVVGTINVPLLSGTNNSCPRGTFSWGSGKKGVGQRDSSQTLQTGIVVITYHTA